MKTLEKKKVVLIGGAGFIGHHLALTLQELGAEVMVVDGLQVNNLLAFRSTATHEMVNRDLYLKIIHERLELIYSRSIPMIVQDARDYSALGRILEQFKPDVVIHLAAVAHAGKSNKDPYSTFDHSLRTLENALDGVRDQGCHFIFFSSSMAYGNFESDEVLEDHVLNPIGIYGALKLAGEKLVIAYNQVFGMDYTIIRPSALYGPRCVSRRVGQVFIENALQGAKLKVEGDGEEKIDFTFIDDLVGGIVKVILSPESRNQIFNLTNGSARTIKDLVEIVTSHFPGSKVDYIPRDRLMPFRGTLNIDKARRLLGYEPKNPIEVGFPKYIEWYKKFFNFS